MYMALGYIRLQDKDSMQTMKRLKPSSFIIIPLEAEILGHGRTYYWSTRMIAGPARVAPVRSSMDMRVF